MTPLSRLEDMLSDFSPLFKHNNFTHFQTFVKGLINTLHRGTLTQIYLSTEQSQRYWSLPKFLSRGVWCVDEVASSLLHQVQTAYPKGVYVYDGSHAVNDGFKQVGTHFFRNTRYQKRNKNQSKFHHGHGFGALGWLAETPEGVRLFPLGARMMDPSAWHSTPGMPVLRSTLLYRIHCDSNNYKHQHQPKHISTTTVGKCQDSPAFPGLMTDLPPV